MPGWGLRVIREGAKDKLGEAGSLINRLNEDNKVLITITEGLSGEISSSGVEGGTNRGGALEVVISKVRPRRRLINNNRGGRGSSEVIKAIKVIIAG